MSRARDFYHTGLGIARSELTNIRQGNPVGITSAAVAVAADVLVIPVTHVFVSKTTGADAEALTLANGVAGQTLVVSLVVAGGGVGTITPATATGWATALLTVAGDTFTFFYVNDTVGWIILGIAGTVAATLPAITI